MSTNFSWLVNYTAKDFHCDVASVFYTVSINVSVYLQVLTPFQQLSFAASSRKEMEKWITTFKLADSKSKHMVNPNYHSSHNYILLLAAHVHSQCTMLHYVRVCARPFSTWRGSTAGLLAPTPDPPTAMCAESNSMVWPGMASLVRSASSRVTGGVCLPLKHHASGPLEAVS